MNQLPLYLDYAATTPLREEVFEAMKPYFLENFGNAASRHHAYGWLAEEALDESKKMIAQKLECDTKEIVFTSGATESINLALKGADFKQIITFKTEHKATLDVCNTLEKSGLKVWYIPIDEDGMPDLELLEKVATQEKSLISALWVNNETGLIFPMEQLKTIVQNTGSLLHIDATQALGKLAVSFKNSAADFLSFSAHKIFGPKGMGGLIVKNNQALRAQIDGGGHQRNRRSGTLNIPGIVGMAKAIELMNWKEGEQLKSLKASFEAEIIRLFPYTKINAINHARVPHISNIRFEGYDGEDLLLKLHKIAISNGSACNSASTLPSHVLKAMRQTDEQALAGIRFSFSNFTTKADLDFAVNHLREILI